MEFVTKEPEMKDKTIPISECKIGDTFMLWTTDDRVFMVTDDENFFHRESQNVEAGGLFHMNKGFGIEYSKCILTIDLKNNKLYLFNKKVNVIKVDITITVKLPPKIVVEGDN